MLRAGLNPDTDLRAIFAGSHDASILAVQNGKVDAAAVADALYEATGGDIECNMRNGIAFLDVERTASTLREAITSAIAEVEGAEQGVRVVRVDSETANTIAQINASLLGETVGQ